jgi:hypothetical protein
MDQASMGESAPAPTVEPKEKEKGSGQLTSQKVQLSPKEATSPKVDLLHLKKVKENAKTQPNTLSVASYLRSPTDQPQQTLFKDELKDLIQEQKKSSEEALQELDATFTQARMLAVNYVDPKTKDLPLNKLRNLTWAMQIYLQHDLQGFPDYARQHVPQGTKAISVDMALALMKSCLAEEATPPRIIESPHSSSARAFRSECQASTLILEYLEAV